MILSRPMPVRDDDGELIHTAKYDFLFVLNDEGDWMDKHRPGKSGFWPITFFCTELAVRIAIHRVRRQLGYPSAAFRELVDDIGTTKVFARESRENAQAADDRRQWVEDNSSDTPIVDVPPVDPAEDQTAGEGDTNVKERAGQTVVKPTREATDLRNYGDARFGDRTPIEHIEQGTVTEGIGKVVTYGENLTGVIAVAEGLSILIPFEHAEAHVFGDDIKEVSDDVEYKQAIYKRK